MMFFIALARHPPARPVDASLKQIPLSTLKVMLRGILLTTGDYSLLVSELYRLKNGDNTENMNKHDKISAFKVKIDTLWNDNLYSHSIVPGGLLVMS